MLENSDDDSPIFHIPDPSQNVEEYVIAKDFVERFLKTLPLKDRQIVELRQDGFTYGFLLFPWSSWLGGRFTLHSVAKIGAFVMVKENK